MKTYKREDIAKLRVPEIRALIRKHNLHTNYIKGYSRLRKAELVDRFMEHYKKSPPERQPALEHIRNALQLNPTDAVAQFRQGLIERSR